MYTDVQNHATGWDVAEPHSEAVRSDLPSLVKKALQETGGFFDGKIFELSTG